MRKRASLLARQCGSGCGACREQKLVGKARRGLRPGARESVGKAARESVGKAARELARKFVGKAAGSSGVCWESGSGTCPANCSGVCWESGSSRYVTFRHVPELFAATNRSRTFFASTLEPLRSLEVRALGPRIDSARGHPREHCWWGQGSW